jgi:hypothetical protein
MLLLRKLPDGLRENILLLIGARRGSPFAGLYRQLLREVEDFSKKEFDRIAKET